MCLRKHFIDRVGNRTTLHKSGRLGPYLIRFDNTRPVIGRTTRRKKHSVWVRTRKIATKVGIIIV